MLATFASHPAILAWYPKPPIKTFHLKEQLLSLTPPQLLFIFVAGSLERSSHTTAIATLDAG
jgi:hypothetical protein